jgi:hypothetical protein
MLASSAVLQEAVLKSCVSVLEKRCFRCCAGAAGAAGSGAQQSPAGSTAQQPPPAAAAAAPAGAAAGAAPAGVSPSPNPLAQAASQGAGGLSVLAGSAFGASPDLNPKNNIAVCKNGATPACAQCQAGWQGANCDACTSSQACQGSLGDPAATCNTGFDYTKCAALPLSPPVRASRQLRLDACNPAASPFDE